MKSSFPPRITYHIIFSLAFCQDSSRYKTTPRGLLAPPVMPPDGVSEPASLTRQVLPRGSPPDRIRSRLGVTSPWSLTVATVHRKVALYRSSFKSCRTEKTTATHKGQRLFFCQCRTKRSVFLSLKGCRRPRGVELEYVDF